MNRMRRGLFLIFAVAMLISCAEEINEPLSSSTSYKILSDATGFTPREAKLIYSWRNCCRKSEPFGGWPGSYCVVYQLGNADFDKIQATRYEKFEWTLGQTRCLGPTTKNERMKGCSEFPQDYFFPSGLNPTLHGETCSSDTGAILKIDVLNRVVMVERYFYE